MAPLHEGIADVLCLLRLPLPLRFVARREIFGWPAIGPALEGLGHVSINPEHPLGGFRGLWRSAETILGGGESLVVFPQGTVAGIESDFQRGVFEVARRVGVPVLPVAVTGTHRVWEHPFSPTLRYGQAVTVQVLPAIPAAEVRAGPRRPAGADPPGVKAAALAPGMPPARSFDPDRDGYWDGYRLDIDPDFPSWPAGWASTAPHCCRTALDQEDTAGRLSPCGPPPACRSSAERIRRARRAARQSAGGGRAARAPLAHAAAGRMSMVSAMYSSSGMALGSWPGRSPCKLGPHVGRREFDDLHAGVRELVAQRLGIRSEWPPWWRVGRVERERHVRPGPRSPSARRRGAAQQMRQQRRRRAGWGRAGWWQYAPQPVHLAFFEVLLGHDARIVNHRIEAAESH